MSVISQDRRLQHFKNISLFGCAGISCGVWHLGSLTRDQARAPCIGSAESYSLDYQESPNLKSFEEQLVIIERLPNWVAVRFPYAR